MIISGDTNGSLRATPSATLSEMKKVINIRRVSSFRTKEEGGGSGASGLGRGGVRGSKSRGSSPVNINSGEASPANSSPLPTLPSLPSSPLTRGCSSGRETPCDVEEQAGARGPGRINTLWGNCIKNYSRMCIPDLDVLVDYPIDYKYPVFSKDQQGEVVTSGFFPADPSALHSNPLLSFR